VTDTTFKWDCQCNNTKFPTVLIDSPPLTQAACGCNNGSCSCCIDKSYID
jgi:hypothetical protein